MVKFWVIVVAALVLPLFVWLAAPMLIASGLVGVVSLPIVLAIVAWKTFTVMRHRDGRDDQRRAGALGGASFRVAIEDASGGTPPPPSNLAA